MCINADTLQNLYDFLAQHREYNDALQCRTLQSGMVSAFSSKEKVLALLYSVWNSQRFPRIDLGSLFFMDTVGANPVCFCSLGSFLELLYGEPVPPSFSALYDGLRGMEGWGPKTSALFAKHVYNIHHRYYRVAPQLAFWQDVPQCPDTLHLPVDSVIKHALAPLDGGVQHDFHSINDLLHGQFSGKEMEVWDDIWFWGFFTQRETKGMGRILQWNREKYWATQHTDKALVDTVQQHAEEFLTLLEQQQG